MQLSQLNKAINIMRRMGDRLIVMDQETDQAIVMMNIDGYEKMLNVSQTIGGLSEDEMIDKINRDIALWRAHNESSVLNWYDGGMLKRWQSDEDDFYDFDDYNDWRNDHFNDFDGKDEDSDFKNPEWLEENRDKYDYTASEEHAIQQFSNNSNESWLDEKTKIAEGSLKESLEDIPSEEEPQFYMEPIE